MSLNKNPIPAFYCCYLLRSTKKASALYVGSTPNPRRRLAQHNGKSIGGAVRTAQENLRPWEMACIVTGFPSNIAALQFEWAWQNSHLTKRIAEDQRITVKKSRVYTNQKTGRSRRRPTRPRTSLIDRLSNLHLLLRVRSFARWPLEVRFFCQDVYDVWLRWSERTHGEIRAGINILLDLERFDKSPEDDEPPPSTQAKQRRKKSMIGKGGVDGVDVGYSTLKDHLEKSRFLLAKGERNSCVICAKDFGSRSVMALVCPHKSCSAAFHMTCLARHFLIVEEQKTSIIPTSGKCPQCESKLQWIDLVKELSVRIRGDDEIARLMKKPEARQGKAAKSKKTSSSHFITDTTENEIYKDHDRELKEGSLSALSDLDEPLSDGWQYLDQDEDDGVSVASGISEYSDCLEAKIPARSEAREPSLEIVIEDSDWDDAKALD